MASGGLGNLTVDLLLETAQWIAGLDKAQYQAEQFATAVEGKLSKMADGLVDKFKDMAIGMAAAFSAEKITEFVSKTVEAAEHFDQLSQRVGMTVDYMAQLSVYAKDTGTSIDTLANSMTKFSKVVNMAASDPNSQAARVFKELGVAVTEADGTMRDSQAIYQDVARTMGDMTDGATKTAAAVFLMGRAGAESIPVWNKMVQGNTDLALAAANYGAEMKKLAPYSEQFNTQLAISETHTQTLAAVLGQQMLPYLTTLIKQWNDASTAGGGFAGVATALMNALKGVVIAADAIVTTFADVITIVTTAYKVLAALNSGDVKGARLAFSDGLAEMAQRSKDFDERLDAMLNPLDHVTTEVKKTTDATKGLSNALATVKVPDIKTDKLEKVTVAVGAMNLKFKEANDLFAQISKQLDLDSKFYGVAEAIEKTNATLGMSSIQAERFTAQINLYNAALAAGRLDEYTEQLDRLNKAFDDKEAKQNYIDFLKDVDSMWHSAFDAMFSSTEGGWKGMLDSLKASFKKMLVDYIYSAFAKPILLNLVAQATGGSVPGSLTQQGGTNNILGNLLNSGAGGNQLLDQVNDYFNLGSAAGPMQPGSAFTSNTFGGIGAAGAGIAGGLIGHFGASALGAGDKGVAAGTQWGSSLATVGMMVYGPIGAAIGAAIGVAIGKFTDPDPDAMRKATFGPTAGATGVVQNWQGKSALGSFGFSAGQWLSSKDMDATMVPFVESIGKMDDALAQFMSKDQISEAAARLSQFSKQYELGMEHGEVTGLGEVLKDRLAIITSTINKGLGDFVTAFQGDTNDVVAIVDAYLQATSGTNFDPEAIVNAIMNPQTMMQTYQAGSAALTDYIAHMDTSVDSMNGLVTGMQAFQTATVQMVAAIDQAAASMHSMFMTTAESIAVSVMTPEQHYQYLQAQTQQLYGQLATETDPATVQKLAEQINANINAAWGLLDDDQKQQLAQQYIDNVNTLDQTVADKMQALRDVVVEDSNTMMESITSRLEVLFASAATTAATEQTAANTMLAAADTLAAGVPVYMATAVVDGG